MLLMLFVVIRGMVLLVVCLKLCNCCNVSVCRGVFDNLFVCLVFGVCKKLGCVSVVLLMISVLICLIVILVIVLIFVLFRLGVSLRNSGGLIGCCVVVSVLSSLCSKLVFCRLCRFGVFGDEMLIVR